MEVWPSTLGRIGSSCACSWTKPGCCGQRSLLRRPHPKSLMKLGAGEASVSFFDRSEMHRLGFAHPASSLSNGGLPALSKGMARFTAAFLKLTCGPRNWEITSRLKGRARTDQVLFRIGKEHSHRTSSLSSSSHEYNNHQIILPTT